MRYGESIYRSILECSSTEENDIPMFELCIDDSSISFDRFPLYLRSPSESISFSSYLKIIQIFYVSICFCRFLYDISNQTSPAFINIIIVITIMIIVCSRSSRESTDICSGLNQPRLRSSPCRASNVLIYKLLQADFRVLPIVAD